MAGLIDTCSQVSRLPHDVYWQGGTQKIAAPEARTEKSENYKLYEY